MPDALISCADTRGYEHTAPPSRLLAARLANALPIAAASRSRPSRAYQRVLAGAPRRRSLAACAPPAGASAFAPHSMVFLARPRRAEAVAPPSQHLRGGFDLGFCVRGAARDSSAGADTATPAPAAGARRMPALASLSHALFQLAAAPAPPKCVPRSLRAQRANQPQPYS